MECKSITADKIKELKQWGDYQNNTNISLVNNYIYFAVDKVANSTIKQYLFDIEYAPVNKKVYNLYDPRCSPLLSPYQLPYSADGLLCDSGLYKFAFVRNPYSRLLSCYLDRILTLSSRPSRQFRKKLKTKEFCFSDFVELVCSQKSSEQNSHWRTQSKDILYDYVSFDFIGKFEHLEPDLQRLHRNLFGSDFDPVVLKNNYSPQKTSAGDKIIENYSQKLLDMVFDAYREDFEKFDYDRIVL